MLDLENNCHLIQLVNAPIRDSSVLDLVFSSEDGMAENIHVMEYLGNSDHNIITWDISLDSTRRNVSKSVHNYNKADYGTINEYFFNIDWEEILA